MKPPSQKTSLMFAIEDWGSRSAYTKYLTIKLQQLLKKYYIRRSNILKHQNPLCLRNYEEKIFSQYGEDGILKEIFRRLGITEGFSVEFGIEDGSECNTRNLLEKEHWSGVLMDGGAKNVESAQKLYANYEKVKIIEAFITAENILEIFEGLLIPTSFDLLSVDIDGNDYWIWERILTGYNPKVIVIEYNAKFQPPFEWVMPYNPSHQWDLSAWFGASLASLLKLGSKYGYTLVCCNIAGNNAFFVRDDLLESHFPDQNRGIDYHYSAPLYCMGFGHPVRPPKSD